MSKETASTIHTSPRKSYRRYFIALAVPVCLGLLLYGIGKQRGFGPPRAEANTPNEAAPVVPQDSIEQGNPAQKESAEPEMRRVRAPELDDGVGWLNTSGPITLRDLKGKIVLLDFWTFCCINCIHTLPDLARLEKKYPNQLVVIGVHSAKFDNERVSENIRKAILRYEISHPVVNDANMRIWRRFGVNSWPTLILIDPEGYAVWADSGEGLYDAADQVISSLIRIHRKKKTLSEDPLSFRLARLRERGDTPLFFPGKVLADGAGKRLFIADSTHHRIVITDLQGKKIAIAGTGEADKQDGPFDKASFNDPQGMALRGETLYVADRRNHLIRALDLNMRTVTTVAGTGQQGIDRRFGGAALRTGLNSPWDLFLHVNTLYIAMAGLHQIWAFDLDKSTLRPYAGNGRENNADGALAQAEFAQPSGLASDGQTLYVADSEASAIRSLPLWGKGDVQTPIGPAGLGLFEFADQDGVGNSVRLQHALGVAFHDGKLYVADTYNSKIKEIDPVKLTATSILGGQNGTWLKGALFSEPGGLSFAGDKMYVADTNNHRIRVVDLKSKTITTLALQGVDPPKLSQDTARPTFPNAQRATLPEARVASAGELAVQVLLRLPAGFKLNPEAKMSYVLETLPEGTATWSEIRTLPEVKGEFRLTAPLARIKDSVGLRLSLVYFECAEGIQAICRVKSQIWDVPLKFDSAATERAITLSGPTGSKDELKLP